MSLNYLFLVLMAALDYFLHAGEKASRIHDEKFERVPAEQERPSDVWRNLILSTSVLCCWKKVIP